MNDTVLTVLAGVAEQMGFLTPTGPGEAPPPDAMVMVVAFTGPAAGRVALGAAPALAETLARNLLACDPEAAVSPEDAREALCELANVVAGNVLPPLLGEGEYRLASPQPGSWPATGACAALDCVEGWLGAAVEQA